MDPQIFCDMIPETQKADGSDWRIVRYSEEKGLIKHRHPPKSSSPASFLPEADHDVEHGLEALLALRDVWPNPSKECLTHSLYPALAYLANSERLLLSKVFN